MIEKINDGGPVFARPDERDRFGEVVHVGCNGMSLHNFHRCLAMHALISAQAMDSIEEVVAQAERYADAMIARRGERNKVGP